MFYAGADIHVLKQKQLCLSQSTVSITRQCVTVVHLGIWFNLALLINLTWSLQSHAVFSKDTKSYVGSSTYNFYGVSNKIMLV